MKHAHRCRSCVHYDLPAIQSRSGAVLSNKTARCLFDLEPLFAQFPSSYTGAKATRSLNWMGPMDGMACPQWELRK